MYVNLIDRIDANVGQRQFKKMSLLSLFFVFEYTSGDRSQRGKRHVCECVRCLRTYTFYVVQKYKLAQYRIRFLQCIVYRCIDNFCIDNFLQKSQLHGCLPCVVVEMI